VLSLELAALLKVVVRFASEREYLLLRGSGRQLARAE
jgi:hypothetical protein